MVTPLHLGLEHPNLLWIALSGIAAFVAGLAVNLYRSSGRDGLLGDDPAEEP